MIQIRTGDLITVYHEGGWITFAILTKQILFGGHWCFVYYQVSPERPAPVFDVKNAGFNAFADFIVPKRQDRIIRISRKNDFQGLKGPELLVQQPVQGESNYGVWKWQNGLRERAEYLRSTPSPSMQERGCPEYTCFSADFICELVKRRWKPGDRWWIAQ